MENQRKKRRRGALGSALLFTVTKALEAPLERILTIRQTQSLNPQLDTFKLHRGKGSWRMFQDVRRECGTRSLWRGLPPMFPAAVAGFLTSSLPLFNGRLLFQWLQLMGLDAEGRGLAAQYSVYLAVSAFASLCSCAAAYPLMVAQTRLNADLGSSPQTRAFLSMGDLFSRLHKLDNSSPHKTFYKGFSAFYLTGQIYMQSGLLMNKLLA